MYKDSGLFLHSPLPVLLRLFYYGHPVAVAVYLLSSAQLSAQGHVTGNKQNRKWPAIRRSVFIPIPKKDNAKECSNYRTSALILLPLIAQLANHLPVMKETWVQFLGWEDPLEKEIAMHSNILAWRIPWTEKPDRLQSMGSQSLDMTEMT